MKNTQALGLSLILNNLLNNCDFTEYEIPSFNSKYFDYNIDSNHHSINLDKVPDDCNDILHDTIQAGIKERRLDKKISINSQDDEDLLSAYTEVFNNIKEEVFWNYRVTVYGQGELRNYSKKQTVGLANKLKCLYDQLHSTDGISSEANILEYALSMVKIGFGERNFEESLLGKNITVDDIHSVLDETTKTINNRTQKAISYNNFTQTLIDYVKTAMTRFAYGEFSSKEEMQADIDAFVQKNAPKGYQVQLVFKEEPLVENDDLEQCLRDLEDYIEDNEPDDDSPEL